MAKPYSNRRLFAEDGYTFLRWITEAEVQLLLEDDEVDNCVDARTDRVLGFKLKKKQEAIAVSDKASLLPFSRPTRPEDHFRYEIPHAGDCRSICLRRYSMRRFLAGAHQGKLGRRIIKVSGRKLDLTAARSSFGR